MAWRRYTNVKKPLLASPPLSRLFPTHPDGAGKRKDGGRPPVLDGREGKPRRHWGRGARGKAAPGMAARRGKKEGVGCVLFLLVRDGDGRRLRPARGTSHGSVPTVGQECECVV